MANFGTTSAANPTWTLLAIAFVAAGPVACANERASPAPAARAAAPLASAPAPSPITVAEREPEPPPPPLEPRALTPAPAVQPPPLPTPPSLRGITRTATLKHNGDVLSVAWSPSGDRIATGANDKLIKIWNAKGKLQRTIRAHGDGVTGLAWSADGSQLASASWDNSVQLHRASDGTRVWTRSFTSRMRAVSFAPDGTRLVVAGDKGPVEVLDVQRGQSVLALQGSDTHAHWEAQFDPTGAYVLTLGGGAVEVYSAVSGQQIWSAPSDSAAVWAADFSEDGAFVVAPARDTKTAAVRTWVTATGAPMGEHHLADAWLVPSSAWSSRGFIAAGDAEGRIALWAPDQREALLVESPFRKNVIDMNFSPDGTKLAAGGYDNVAKVWSLRLAP